MIVEISFHLMNEKTKTRIMALRTSSVVAGDSENLVHMLVVRAYRGCDFFHLPLDFLAAFFSGAFDTFPGGFQSGAESFTIIAKPHLQVKNN